MGLAEPEFWGSTSVKACPDSSPFAHQSVERDLCRSDVLGAKSKPADFCSKTTFIIWWKQNKRIWKQFCLLYPGPRPGPKHYSPPGKKTQTNNFFYSHYLWFWVSEMRTLNMVLFLLSWPVALTVKCLFNAQVNLVTHTIFKMLILQHERNLKKKKLQIQLWNRKTAEEYSYWFWPSFSPIKSFHVDMI